MLRGKAQEFAKLLKGNAFLCSEGWFDRFKIRHSILFRDVCGEAANGDNSESEKDEVEHGTNEAPTVQLPS